MKIFINFFQNSCNRAFVVTSSFVQTHCALLLGICGLYVLVFGSIDMCHAQAGWDDYVMAAIANVIGMIEGSFGALILVVAALVALVGVASGSWKGAMNVLIIALGAFILRSIIYLFFGQDVTSGSMEAMDARL